MKILLLGGTGRTGKWVLSAALENGHEVHCLSRNTARFEQREGLTIFEGDVQSAKDLERAMQGCEAIISCLNVSRTSDFPWAPLRSPADLMSSVMEKMIPLAGKMNIKRLVMCSAWGVHETRAHIPWWFRLTIDMSKIGVAYKDHERQEELIAASNLDWTLVRPVGLTPFTSEESVRESFDNQPKPSILIARKTLGRFMVECLEREDLVGKRVVVSKG